MLKSSISAPVLLGKDLEKANSGENGHVNHSTDTQIASWKFTRGRTRWFSHQPETPQPKTRVRHDIKPRKGHVFRVDEAKIFEATQHHNNYSHGGSTLSGLAKFDDCTDYGISKSAEKDLLKLEVHRLVQAVNADGPYLFSSDGLLSKTDVKTFEEVAAVADQIFCNMQTVRHDCACLSMKHITGNIGEALKTFRFSRDRLMNRFREDETHTLGSAPKLIEPPDRNQKLYFALVDYIMCSVGRLIVRTATGDYWHCTTLAVLAQWSTKLKVLSHDPRRYATMSLDNGESVIEELNEEFRTRQRLFLNIQAPDDEGPRVVDALDSEPDLSYRYYREKTHFRQHLYVLVSLALDSLLNPQNSTASASCFETCAQAYRTGLEGLVTILSNDRTGQISASSQPFLVKCSYTAMELVMKNLQTFAGPAEPKLMPEVANQDILTRITWEWVEDDDTDEIRLIHTDIFNMDRLISIVVPLGLPCTYGSMALDLLVTLANHGTDEEDPIVQFEPPPRNWQALFTVSTADWIRKEKLMSRGKYRDQDVVPVSGSPMRLGIRAGTNMAKMFAGSELSAMSQIETRATEVTTRYQNCGSRMDKWVSAEESITIKCHRYVISIISLAILIVCGGVAVPFAVGTRIRGVDPFQITTFAWLLAGFITIIAKSRYVSEWPWHDFLRGRVVCRSVKEVCDVTGIDSQMVLMYLLLEERSNTLRTKGPYNGMFIRVAEGSNGFSIDEPVQLSTMLASGFIILKVLNEYGEHLVCLDVRKGSAGQAPMTNQVEELLACMNIYKDAESNALDEVGVIEGRGTSRQELEKVKKLTLVKLRWFKILGLYIHDSTFG